MFPKVRHFVITLLAFVLLGVVGVVIYFAGRSFVHQPSSPAADQSAPVPAPTPTYHSLSPFSAKVREMPPREVLPPNTLRILVLGDSVSKFLGLAMRYRQEEKQTFVAERGVGDCSIFEPKPYIENGKQLMSSSCSQQWAEDVAELRPDMTLIVMGGGFFSENACTKDFQTAYEKRVEDLTHAMGKSAGQIVITRVPYPVKSWRHSNVMERVDCFNEVLVKIAQKAGYPMVDLMSHVCPTRACNMESDGKPIRPDGLHFDGGGTEETARWVLDELGGIYKKAAPK